MIRFIPNEFMIKEFMTNEIIKLVVEKNEFLLHFIPDHLITDEIIEFSAIQTIKRSGFDDLNNGIFEEIVQIRKKRRLT